MSATDFAVIGAAACLVMTYVSFSVAYVYFQMKIQNWVKIAEELRVEDDL